MNRNVPFPDHFSTGIVEFDDQTDLRPGDMVRLRQNGDLVDEYELLSVREDGSVMVDMESREKPQHLSEEEFKSMLGDGDTYVWTLLNRAVLPVEDGVGESLVLFAYAFSHEGLPDDECMLAVVWSVTEQDPVTMMPSSDGMISSPRFDMLREALSTGEAGEGVSTPDNGLQRLYDEFNEERLSTVLDEFIVVAEFNATKLLDFYTEPTFDAETERRLERDAISMEASIEASRALYD